MKKAMIAVAALAFSGAAAANGPAWTYIDAGAVFVDSGDDQTTGGAIEGSFGLDLFHVNGSYVLFQDVEGLGDDGEEDDLDGFRVGVGIHPAITDSTDLVVEVGYSTFSADDSDADPDAIDLTLGVRSMITDQLELNAFVVTARGDTDTDAGDFQDAGISIGGQYFFTDNFSVNASGSEDVSQIGVRFSF